MESKLGQRLLGVFFLFFGIACTAWSWYTRLVDDYYYPKLAALGSALAVTGLGMILFPDDDMSKFERWENWPPVWKLIMVLSLVTAFINWCLLANL